MPSLFERRTGGELWCTMHGADAEVLAFLADGLVERLALDSPEDAEVFGRLFPRAFLDPTEETAIREWDSFVRPDLVRGKASALARLSKAMRSASPVGGSGQMVTARLDDDDVEAWLTALNDLRIDLGTRLGVSEDLDPAAVDPDDPDAPWWSVYTFLTWCQGMLVEVLLGGAGDDGEAVSAGV